MLIRKHILIIDDTNEIYSTVDDNLRLHLNSSFNVLVKYYYVVYIPRNRPK